MHMGWISKGPPSQGPPHYVLYEVRTRRCFGLFFQGGPTSSHFAATNSYAMLWQILGSPLYTVIFLGKPSVSEAKKASSSYYTS